MSDPLTDPRRPGASPVVASFRCKSWANQRPALAAVSFVFAIAVAIALGLSLTFALASMVPVIAAVLLAVVGFTYVGSAPGHVEVGDDGVQLRWLWFQRFLRHDQIESVDVEPGLLVSKVAIRTSDGETVRLLVQRPTPDQTEAYSPAHSPTATEISNCLRAAKDRQIEDPAPRPPLLDRGEQSSVAWVRNLRAAGQSQRLRVATDSDRLWRIAEDASDLAVDRAAAAVALSARLSGPQRLRIQELAEATAAPPLRNVFAAVADDVDEEALAEALQRVAQVDS